MPKSSIKLLEKIAEKSSHRLLALSFFPLHFSVWGRADPTFSKILFILHIGLFLVWQPFVSHKTQIQARPTIIIVLSVLGISFLGGGWAQMIWIVLLIGILSSYRLAALQDRMIVLMIISYLLIELFGSLLPLLFFKNRPLLIDSMAIQVIALSLNTVALLLPSKFSSFRNYSSDLLYSLIAISIVVVLAMTTLLWMEYGQKDYYISLIYSMLSMAGILIVFNLIFRPNSDVGLFKQFTDRYALNLGTPFETFLIEAAEISEKTDAPDEYLESAFDSLCSLSWVSGFRWESEHGSGKTGTITPHNSDFTFELIKVTLFSQNKLGQAMRIHAGLLIRLIEILFTAKIREISLSRSAHMEAIYETGARLTHDIKNLLQSLTLMLSATQDKPMSIEDSRLFFKNLEIITQRLQQTLVKLRNPETLSEHLVPIDYWWTNTQQREKSTSFVHFSAQLESSTNIPEELFNSVFENLVDNAKKKHKREPDLEIRVTLKTSKDNVTLTVQDTGSPVPEQIAKDLLSGPVKSRSGFGIGLYQATKQANAHGFKLLLEKNIEGDVCFALKRY